VSVRKVIDVPADVRRWMKSPPSVEDARADLQRAMGKLVFAHSARLQRTGSASVEMAPALAIVDVFECVCMASESVGWDPQELVDELQLVIERWAKGEATP
jgi:hypothetical protein